MDQYLVENICDVPTMIAESRSLAASFLQQMEENSTDANDEDAVMVLHFDRRSVYKLVTLLTQLALAAAKNKAS